MNLQLKVRMTTKRKNKSLRKMMTTTMMTMRIWMALRKQRKIAKTMKYLILRTNCKTRLRIIIAFKKYSKRIRSHIRKNS